MKLYAFLADHSLYIWKIKIHCPQYYKNTTNKQRHKMGKKNTLWKWKHSLYEFYIAIQNAILARILAIHSFIQYTSISFDEQQPLIIYKQYTFHSYTKDSICSISLRPKWTKMLTMNDNFVIVLNLFSSWICILQTSFVKHILNEKENIMKTVILSIIMLWGMCLKVCMKMS